MASAMAATLCLGISSCSESDELADGKYTVSLKPHKLNISAAGGSTYLKTQTDDDNNFTGYKLECDKGSATYIFSITAENTPWSITGVPNWMSISSRTGNSSQNITMNVQANTPTETVRTANLQLTSTDPEWEYSIPITVTQDAATATLYKKTQFGNFDADGGSGNATFSANFTPTIGYEDNDGNWILATIEKDNDTYYNMPCYKLNVTVKPNTETTSRRGYIQLLYNGKEITNFEVYQYAFYPSVSSISSSYLIIDQEGETRTVTYTANFTPTLSTDEVKDWCEASIDTAQKTITIKVKPNYNTGYSRSGYIYMMYGSKKVQSIQIYQRGY